MVADENQMDQIFRNMMAEHEKLHRIIRDIIQSAAEDSKATTETKYATLLGSSEKVVQGLLDINRKMINDAVRKTTS